MYTCNFNMFILLLSISSTQSLNRVQLFATPWTTAHQGSLSITNSRSPPKPMSIVSVMPSAISSSVVPFSSFLPASESFQMSQLFAWGDQSTGISVLASFPSKEISGLISFSMDWLDFLAVQGTLKSLLQHHKSIHSSFLKESCAQLSL